MNSYKLSNGSRQTKKQIDLNIRLAKVKFRQDKFDDEECYCVCCGVSGELDVSHIVSVDDCQKEGKSEQAWNTENFELLCRGCHTNYEKQKTFNKKRLLYVTKWFPELARKYLTVQ